MQHFGKRVLAASTLAMAAFATVSFSGEEKKATKSTDKEERGKLSADARAVLNLKTAFDLANYGRNANMPEALIASARMLADIDVKPGKAEKIDGPGVTDDKTRPIDLRKEALQLVEL